MLKYGNLSFLELSGPVQASIEIVLSFKGTETVFFE
jgi:hypothetical protein